MAMTQQTAMGYTVDQGGTVPIRSSVTACLVATLAAAMVVVAALLGLAGLHHWATVSAVTGAATAGIAGMIRTSHVHKMHKR